MKGWFGLMKSFFGGNDALCACFGRSTDGDSLAEASGPEQQWADWIPAALLGGNALFDAAPPRGQCILRCAFALASLTESVSNAY